MLFGQAERAVGLCFDLSSCSPAILDWGVREEEKKKKKRQSLLAHLISSGLYFLPGPVCAADSSVGPIAAGGSTVHAADGAVQHIMCCTG